MARIVTIGEILVEMVATRVGQRLDAPGSFEGPYPSGAPAIFADQAARQGVSTALIGCVGQDGFGDATLRRLERDGVDLRGVRRTGEVATGVAFVAYRADGGRGFLFHMANAAAGRLEPDDVRPELFAGCRVLHVMGSSLFSAAMGEAIRRGLHLARAAGAAFSFDPNIRPELLGLPGTAALIRELAAQADILLPSEADLDHLFPGLDADAAARAALAGGAERVLLKRGAAGSLYHDRDSRIETPGFPVAELDPTGAGDCAGATFVAALVRDVPIRAALLRANAAGALAVSRRGPMEGNSTEAELDAFLQARGIGA